MVDRNDRAEVVTWLRGWKFQYLIRGPDDFEGITTSSEKSVPSVTGLSTLLYTTYNHGEGPIPARSYPPRAQGSVREGSIRKSESQNTVRPDTELINQNEIDQITKRRTAFETSLIRRQTRKEDFFKYAEYEINLEKLRKVRWKRLSA
jgi:hypothetical protein